MSLLTLIITVMLLDLFSLATPGQDFMIVTRNTLKYSQKIGVVTAVGIGAASLVHALIAMLGVSVILSSNEALLALIRTAGALYLIYLGSQFVRQAGKQDLPNEQELPQFDHGVSKWQAIRMGFITTLLNVEAMLFSMSVFTVVLPTGLALSSKLIIASVIAMDALVWYALVSILLGHKPIKRWYLKQAKWIEKAAGAVLIFFGSRTIISQK